MNRRIRIAATVAAVVLLVGSSALAQETGKDGSVDALPAAASPNEGKESQVEAGEETLESRVARMEQELERQASRAEELEKSLNRVNELESDSAAEKKENERLRQEIADLKDEVELDSAESEAVTSTTPVSVFGFFDLTYFKGFYDENSPYNLYLPSAGTFAVTNANVYFKSEMTESLSAIMELRFSFLPHGQESQYEDETHLADGTVVSTGNEYVRTNTTVRDPMTTLEFQQGGLTIERVHLTYSPFDWLNVVAGRFLTPYGIWNIDHGSPVVLLARIPNLQYREIMPLAQTGFQIFGRLFPSDTLSFDYGVTLSNGRGPTEALRDLDENKGVGLRLRLNFAGKHVTFFAGSYGYFGEYTNSTKRSVVYLDENNLPDPDRNDALTVETTVIDGYREIANSYDLMLSFFGVKIQSEAVWRRVRHTVHPRMKPEEAVLNSLPPTEELYKPDYIGWGAYVLASYTIPLPLEWLQITPYVMYEKGDPFEVVDMAKLDIFSAGLNVKPSPYVTLKAEYMRGWAGSRLLDTVNSATLQMAVSF